MIVLDISRKQAFLAHLAVSATVFAVISGLIIFYWFPDYYFYLDGGIQGVATIFFVDVVLGPGLTLLVFKPGKKNLKFDMAVIVLLQLSALVWGVKNVYTERPGATVFYLGKFSCLTQSDSRDMDMQAISAGPSGEQRLAFLQRPDSVDELLEFTKHAFAQQSSAIYYYGEKMVPLDERVVSRLPNYKLNLSALASENELAAAKIKDYLAHHEEDVEYIYLMPLSCRYDSAIAVFDSRALRITDLIDVQTTLQAEAQDEPLPLRDQLEN